MKNDMNFIALTANDKLFVDLQYPKRKLENAVDECLLRTGTADRLVRASKRLPKGMGLCVWDAWRPLSLQLEVYRQYAPVLEEKGLPAGQYVEEPCRIFGKEPVHTTGGAVAVTLCDMNGKPFDLGTGFDEFVPAAAVFAESVGFGAAEYRAMLRSVMLDAGFALYEPLWWQFHYGDRLWAEKKGKAVKYRGIFARDGIVE